MKIYIVNVLPEIIKNKLDNFSSLLVNKREKYEINSEEYGLHIVEHPFANNNNNKEQPKIYKIESTFDTNYHLMKDCNFPNNHVNYNVDLLFDLTKYVQVPVVSQLPTKYVLTKITQFVYKSNKKSKWSLIIECIRETNIEILEKEWIPINFYFEYNYSKNEELITNLQNHDNLLFQEEINMFLTHLN